MNRRTQGFTLLELAIVLLVISTITGMAITSGIGVIRSARFSSTQQKMASIEKALQSYRATNDRLPCPADLTIAEGVTNFGVEAATPGNCTTGTPAANSSAAGAANTGTTGVEGAVPVVTLGLPNNFMYDGWGHRFRYAVDKTVTATRGFATVATTCTNRAITIKDATSGNTITSGAIYALVSHGENGHGGFTKNAGTVPASTGSTNTDEQTNCHCNSTGVATTYAPIYIQKDPSTNSSVATDTFDDIVTYKERWQMMVAWEKVNTCGLLYVLDWINCNVQVFDTDGNYQSKLGGTCGSGNGQCNGPESVSFTREGNIWVEQEQSGGRVDIFDGSGNYVSQFTSPNGGDILQGMYDSSGYMWAVNWGSGKIEKYTSTGTYITSCNTVNTSGPNGLSVDSHDNIWALSMYSYRIEKYSNACAFVQYYDVGAYFTSHHPSVSAIDFSDNIWVMSGETNTIVKFDSNMNFLFQIGGPGSGNGQFNTSGCANWGIAVDPNNNIYVTDCDNNRVQKFDSSGNFIMKFGSPGTGSLAVLRISFTSSDPPSQEPFVAWLTFQSSEFLSQRGEVRRGRPVRVENRAPPSLALPLKVEGIHGGLEAMQQHRTACSMKSVGQKGFRRFYRSSHQHIFY